MPGAPHELELGMLGNVGLDRLHANVPVMIESISAVTLATHNVSRAVRFTAHWDLKLFMVALMTLHLRVFELDLVTSI
jgi:hypothetical protein